jgi:chemotaxis regulatin CheY-phosphate phosphatase CheZ
MGRIRRDEKHTPQKNNLIQYSERNEENGYSVPDPNKTMKNDTKETSNAHKNMLKEEILQEITKNFMKKILEVINQIEQDALKKFQDTKNKEHEKTQKQINELRGTLNKHQSETENTIER